jgi:hypothetical protein
VLTQRGLAAGQVQRGPALGAGLGQDERARREVERGQAHLAGDAGAGRFPVQAARNHQVDDDEQLVFERDDDALAEPAEAGDLTAGDGRGRRIDGAQQERARDPDALEPRAIDARPQRLDVDGDVRKLRHGSERPGSHPGSLHRIS